MRNCGGVEKKGKGGRGKIGLRMQKATEEVKDPPEIERWGMNREQKY